MDEHEILNLAEAETTEQRLSLSATGWVNSTGKFEIDAITVGEGRGWMFSEECLRESVPLWDGVECFVDHGGWFGGRSVRDLGGVFQNPRWADDSKGVRLDLDTLGPSGPLVEELGRQMLAETEARKPKIGFSADVLFTARGRDVQKILRVVSLDLVFNPARGGAFVRALNSMEWPGHGQNGGVEVAEQIENVVPATPGNNPPSGNGGEDAQGLSPMASQLQRDVEAVRQFLAVQEERQKLAEEAEAARGVRLQMCQFLLEAGLSAAKLPTPMTEHVRRQFENKVFEPTELSLALEEARNLVSDLTGGATVFGPTGRVHAMFSTEDQLQAAVDDLLGAPRNKNAENLQVAKLSGIKELYMMLTGDSNLYGGFYPERVQLATTANFTGLVKNALNKIVANQWDLLGAAGYDWWMRITLQEHFETLNTVTGTLVGTVGALPTVAEGGEYTELKVGDSPETADFTKYGGYVPLTLELIDRDNTRKLAQYPRELAKAGIRKISGLVAAIFTDNAGVGPTMADTGALFNATAVTTAGGHANLRTTALSSTEWEDVCNAMYSQPLLIANEAGLYGAGPAMAIDPKFLLVPRELRLTAMKILYPEWENTANVHSENLQRGDMGDVVVVPEWTDATDWAAVCDPRLMPGIVVCERFGLMPEIFIAGDELSPAVFMNDEHRIKVRHFLAVLIQDYRPLHKSNVAA